MASASLQLDLESALKSFLAGQGISNLGLTNIFPAHAKEKIAPDTKGTYLGIIADTPDWTKLIVNAEIKVTFEFATAGMQDHDVAPAQTADHFVRTGQLIDLFCYQNFESTLASLNSSASSSGIGFSGWQELKPEPDGTSQDGTQLITKLAYSFEVFLS